ncbi:MAG TPA: SDR family oxidoreductase, partial [Herpetosiphonaceae bacterium]
FDFNESIGYFDKQSLHGRLQRVPPEFVSAVVFVEVGPPNPGVQIRIVDQANRVLPEGVIGRLQVKGAIVTPGYLDNPAANREAFTDDGWFYTGDLSMILDGRLMITGREKEVIIVNGANFYCYEIEDVVKQLPGVEGTSVGVCEVVDPRSGSEGIAVCFTPTVATLDEQLEVIAAIRARVVAAFGLSPAAIVPIPKDQFPKTTSGKIQRTQLKAALAGGQFDAILKAIDIRLANSNTLPDWFYRKVWQPKAGHTLRPRSEIRRALVFLDTLGLGAAVRAELAGAGVASIGVEQGKDFAQPGQALYRIDPRNPEHYRRLLDALAQDRRPIDQILHLWSYAPWSGEPTGGAAIERALDEGLYSLLFLVQALSAAQDRAASVQLDVVSSFVQAVTPGDRLACERATIPGLVKTIPHELAWLNARHIDLPPSDVAANAAYVLREIRTAHKDREIAYRDGRRLVVGLEPAPRPEAATELPFKKGGMYVLSGGLGGIGSLIAAHLGQRYGARLLILGRTPLPEGDAQTELAQTWRMVQQSGGDVIYADLDICDAEQLRAAVAQAQQRWQCPIDGVLHLAGVYHDQLLSEATRDSFDALLRPKLLGAWNLHQLVNDRPGSLFVSFSSVHSFFGGFNVGAYAAANSFLDAFAHYQRESGALNSYSFAWSIWEKLGISRELEVQDQLEARGYATLSPQQGLYSLLAGLRLSQPYLAVGLDRTRQPIAQALVTAPHRAQVLRGYFTSGDTAPIEQLQHLTVQDRFGTRSSCDFVQLKALPKTAEGTIDRLALAELDGTHAPRKASYVAPQTEFERTIAAIWQSALRIDKVGIHDNFFDLGGQSLLMTQVQGKLRAALNRDISMVDMFKYPTISALAKYLSREQAAPVVATAPAASADRTAKQKEAIARRKQQAAQRRKESE